MNLQGRNLELNVRGDDVALLQDELRSLDFQIADPPNLFGSTTLVAVQRFQAGRGIPVTGIVDARTARLINQAVDALPREQWEVQGRLLHANGDAVARARVRAFEKHLRRETPLGDTVPDETGHYRITYPVPRDGSLSVIARAVDAQGTELAASKVICNAKPVETVDLVVGNESLRGPSLFAQLQETLRPLLAAEHVIAAELTTEDIEWLACRHDLNAQHLARLADAARLARDAQLPREHEPIFGLVMQHLPIVLESLIAQSADSLRLALEQSIEDNVIDRAQSARIPQIIEALQAVIVRLALREPTPDRPSFALVFDLAGTSPEHRETVLNDYVRREGTVAEFWEAQARRLGDEAVSELQEVIRLSALTMNHEPLLRQLMRMRSAGEIGRDLNNLARFSRDDWQRLLERTVDGRRIGAPEFLGTEEADRTARFATFLARYIEAGAPTPVLAERLATDTPSSFDSSLSFLRRHQSFDFRTQRVDEFLRANPAALEGDADPATTRTTLRAMQRMYDVAPPFDKHRTVRLVAQGIDSATQIRRVGESAFVAQAAETLGGEAEARTVYAKAALKADSALMLLSNTAHLNPTPIGVLPPQLLGPGIPDLQDLFGTLDTCQCLHCASVYSPAAYLVDILHFLMNRRSATDGRSALDVLFERRPDIGEVDLDCDNTHRTLPYVDLVVEILENAVAAGGGFPFQTQGHAADLLASPEHMNEAAYDRLRTAIYPWTLPFDVWAEIARTYLAHLGVPRHELMQRFRSESDASKTMDVALEYLTLTAVERDLLTDPSLEPTPASWGFVNAGSIDGLVESNSVATLLERARLTYEELGAMLMQDFVDSNDNPRIHFAGADCNLETAEVTNLSTALLERLHRFARLQRRLPWSIEELGAVLRTLDISSLDVPALIRIADVKRLQQLLNVPLRVLLGWWPARMDTRGIGSQPSLYADVFLDPSANRPEMQVFRLNPSGFELVAAAEGALISGNLTAIHAALGISASDLDLLRADLQDDDLNIRNLTRLYRPASLAKALRLKVADFLALRTLTGVDPIGPDAATSQTMQFIETALFAQRSGYSLAKLDYLLRHRFAANATFVPSDADIGRFLAELRTALRAIAAQYALAPAGIDATDPGFVADPDGARTARHLAAVLPPDALNGALALIRSDAENSPADPEAFVQTHFAVFLDLDEAVERLVSPGTLTSVSERFNYVLERLIAHLDRTARIDRVITSVADALDVDATLAAALLRDLVRSPADGERAILEDFIDNDFVGALTEAAPPLTFEPSTFPVQFASYERLYKLVEFTKLFGIGESHLEFVVRNGPVIGWVDIAALPLDAVNNAQTAFAAFQTMAHAIQAGSRLPGGLDDFFALLQRLDTADMNRELYLNDLALRTGWNRADIEFLAGPQVLGLSYPEGFRDGSFLANIGPAVAQLKRLGIAASTALEWSALTITPDTSRTMLQAARSKHADKNAWLAVARPLRDVLRERQRAALVDLLIHERGLRSANDLYGHYLVDVEMSPCMLTSRMVLATASVQLFVQRCLLNLETDVPPSAIDTDQWEWMNRYRVWEANRKVFLYPENWIQPELRDNKSAFFVALERGLSQDEINDATVEREYLKYLEALNQVANLEIAGLYVGDWEKERDVLHVFGRTHNAPRHYYYRRWNRASWTSWEPVEASIEGDHLVPAIWNRRLYLMWPLLTDKTHELFPPPDDPSLKPILRFQSASLQWSEYRQGQWSPKQVSHSTLDLVGSVAGTAQYTVYAGDQISFWTDSINRDAMTGTFSILDEPLGISNIVLHASGESAASVADEPTASWHPFPNTAHQFNHMKSEGAGNVSLRVWTTSGTDDDAPKPVTVLQFASRPFRIAFKQDERPFFCRTPFFYQDQQRSFMIVPDGRYLLDGGSGSPLADQFLNPLDPTHGQPSRSIPLDVADRVTTFHATMAVSALGTSPASAAVPAALPGHWETTSFAFHSHYHPFVRLLIEQLNRFGIEGILKPTTTMEPHVSGSFETLRRQALFQPYFFEQYGPNQDVVENVRDLSPILIGLPAIMALQPRDDFDFSFGGAYAGYNWELFFHVPLLIAKRLSANRRFAEAHRWLSYVFDPTDPPPESEGQQFSDWVWNIKPFVEYGQGRTIEQLMLLLHTTGLTQAEKELRQELNYQIKAWRANPFNPHLIARMRVQPYMMAVVMAYLDNLIAWADDLFRQDTMESINEASQLYVLAAEILGERPQEIAAHEGTHRTIDGQPVTNFNDLRDHLDAFSNALVDLETVLYAGEADQGASNSGGLFHVSEFTVTPSSPPPSPALEEEAAPVPAVIGPTLFFCIPRNDNLVGYWDTVADRLFKIRHCMNIEGVVRQLPLFEPPIDPALLVQAAAAGVDLSRALASLNGPVPNVRFAVLVEKAREFAAEVKYLGSLVLAGLEKRDGEQLALLRSGQEKQLLESMRIIKDDQIRQLEEDGEALRKSKAVTEARHQHYEHLLAADPETGETLNESERGSRDAMLETIEAEDEAGSERKTAANLARFLPDIAIGWAGMGPLASIAIGRQNFIAVAEFGAVKASNRAAAATGQSNSASMTGSWARRDEQWEHERDQAKLELDHVDALIAANDVRIAIAQHERDVHEKQIAHAEEVDDFMHAKYTASELYDWIISRVSSVHFQAFQLASDLAMQAERAFRFELGIRESSFIQPGHWDSLKKGLLAGEFLTLDLARMSATYLEQNKREYELTKHISVRQLNPVALLALRATGICEVVVPEWLLDLDCPGHYLRRLKSVSLSIPCVVGPYASVNCTASLLSSTVRTSSLLAGGYTREGEDAARFTDYFGTIQSIVTSSGNNDSGLFEANLRDERYLPFEGSGAIGRWRLELPGEFRQFDYNTISDAIIHLRYTAREGGTQLRHAAVESLSVVLAATNESGPVLLVSLRNDYPGEWHRYVNGESLTVPFGRDRFPYIAQGHGIEVLGIGVISLTNAAPVSTALTAQQVGLAGFPVFAAAEQDEISLVLADDTPVIERDPDAHIFLLIRYAIE